MKIPLLAFLFLFSALAGAQEPKKDEKPKVLFPTIVQKEEVKEPTPVPKETPTKLYPYSVYLIRCDAPIAVTTEPAGFAKVVKVRKEADKDKVIKYGGIFVDGKDTIEERDVAEKYVFRIEYVKPGKCVALVLRLDGNEENTFERANLEMVPLGPQPPPKPVDPVTPTPKPVEPSIAPIPADGLHVLIVYETEDILSGKQNSILYGKTIRDYLDSHCAKGPDGKTSQARIWDKDTDASGESKLWQDALKRPRQSIPWIIVSNGKEGFEGPLPATVDETLTLLRKYGGQ
jgi:hypothetical protein